MQSIIKSNLEHPARLEQLYRTNKRTFTEAFEALYPEISGNLTAQVWHERLAHDTKEISWGTGNELLFIIIATIFAGLVVKIPAYTGISEAFFYPRNLSFIFLPMITAFFAWKNQLKPVYIGSILLNYFIALIYINLLPGDMNTDTLILACVHLPILMWGILGFAFTGNKYRLNENRVTYLRFNGELVVMTAIILLAGGLMTAITFGLFNLIGLHIEEFYFQNFGLLGLAAAPIVATYLIHTNPQLVNKVSPVIARVFTPLVLVTLLIYLSAVLYTGKDPYNDRDFLLVFNLLLIGTLAIILFAITGSSSSKNKFNQLLLLALAIVTILVNGVALSAILFRISEWGITPNRLAVFGSNILILTHLLLVANQLFRSLKDHTLKNTENTIAAYLPVYLVWTAIVAFGFPLLFGFK